MFSAAIRDDLTVPPPAAVLDTQTPTVAASSRGIDVIFLFAVLALVGLGTVEVYSASAVYAQQKFGNPNYFLIRQLVYLVIGLVAMGVAAEIDFSRYQKLTYPFLGGSLLMLAAVLKVGARINEARRWFKLGPLSFQPVELAKLGLVVYLAYSLAKKREKVKTFTVGFMPHLAVCGMMIGLLLLQPDLGSSMILGATTLVMLFIAGAKVSYLLLALLAGAPVVYHSIVATAWRLRRLLAYVDPWMFRKTTGYQITESLISMGSGGWFGQGLGEGKQKLFLPEAHTDFILSNIGEELGFAGVCAVLFLFVVIMWRGAKAALAARDTFGTYLAAGLTTMFALQALVNTAVVLGAVPAKGITLPFVSYGGTSLVVSMFFAGIILNVSRRAPLPTPRAKSMLQNIAAENRKKRKPVRVVVD